MSMQKPILAFTMGDAAGIGPELIAKVVSEDDTARQCRPLIIGDAQIIQDAARIAGTTQRFRIITDVSQARFSASAVEILCPEGLQIPQLIWGKIDAGVGRAAALCLATAFELAAQGQVHAVLSAPINKEGLHLAGVSQRDDLTYLAELTSSPEAFIMGVMGKIWTVSIAEHVAFAHILDYVKYERILSYIIKLHEALGHAGNDHPRIAVAALNVHAGDGGLFGNEEIAPAVKAAQARGISVEGPIPADMVFVLALEGRFDGVACMHHDQANIARKLQPRNEGATLLMGLPVPCGTTAHGTAFDIAGKGIADPGSLRAAMRITARLARQP
jgi:4-hydroxy-L-threonine phosphate dehydrogenase PdxA